MKENVRVRRRPVDGEILDKVTSSSFLDLDENVSASTQHRRLEEALVVKQQDAQGEHQ
jgi:hypothetical protein